MKVDVYEYSDLGYIIDPESDTKTRTIILVGKQTVKCNPRQAIIYVSSEKIDKTYEGIDRLKEACADNRVVLICPGNCDIATLDATYKYLFKNYLDLNVFRDKVILYEADTSVAEAVSDFREYLLDEYDVEADIKTAV